MTQSAITKPFPSQTVLSFNMQNVDDLFPGFEPGDFTLIHGASSLLNLSLVLAVRAQLPFQLGGFESNVVFVDGGNTFRLYTVSRTARLNHLQPRQALQRIFISRAFTAHQMTSIILERLEETVAKYHAKLVIVSDFAGLYLDKDVAADESKETFGQVAAYLSEFAERNHVTVLITYPPHGYSRRNAFFHAVAYAKSKIAILITKKTGHRVIEQFVLEKHPTFKLGCADFPSENLTLNDFIEGE